MNDILASTSAPESSHYLRAVTDMAQQCAVVAQDAIYTDNGIKLVDKGVQINGHLYDRLVQHKLREPIDSHLSVEGAVNTECLLAAALALTDSAPLARLLVQKMGSAQALLAPLQAMPLPASMAFKLTVMREQRPDLFQHSVLMVLVAGFLGIQSGLKEDQRVALAAAALLHDIGVLHMDSAWLDPQHTMTGAERKHLVAHPITAMLMVRDAQVYPRAVEVAVMEHHERLDGTGYPRSLMGEQISPLGRILLLSEVVTAFYDKYPDTPAQQLALVLRLNYRKFPADLSAQVLVLLHNKERSPDADLAPLGADASRYIDSLGQAFALWESAKQSVPEPALAQAMAQGGNNLLGFVDVRLRALAKVLAEAGAHPDQQSVVIEQLQGDDAGLAEIAVVWREALWQLQNIVNAGQRRWPASLERTHPADVVAAQWCEKVHRPM
ncbi:HD-GYP domain-containing protein [Simplicispira psychrophila]|uniref:HD-GYP domain-containing protein n=1 Tax=Simplicispira psychrophila TaxID=80882 RepID=UPI000489E0A2|nr:HD domain-containing phosphohydrolase [Simplicispira psychrophila]